MIIGVAGPYSAPTEDERRQNFEALNIAAARVYEKGHIPFIGLNMALPVLAQATVTDHYAAVMDISLSVINQCDALLVIGESRGVTMERDMIVAKGKPVFYSVEEIPNGHQLK